MTILEKIRARASPLSRRVVLPEGTEERTVEAAARTLSQQPGASHHRSGPRLTRFGKIWEGRR